MIHSDNQLCEECGHTKHLDTCTELIQYSTQQNAENGGTYEEIYCNCTFDLDPAEEHYIYTPRGQHRQP